MPSWSYEDIDRIVLLGLKIVRQAVEDYNCIGSNSVCDDYPLRCKKCKVSARQFLEKSTTFRTILELCNIELPPQEFLKKVGFRFDGTKQFGKSRNGGELIESLEYRFVNLERVGSSRIIQKN